MATGVAAATVVKLPCRRPPPSNCLGFGPRNGGRLRLSCLSADPLQQTSAAQHKSTFLDDLFLHLFRSKMVKETKWDSAKPGYEGLIEVANRLMIGHTNTEAQEASTRILASLFPPFLLKLYSLLISPIEGGKLAAVMVARVTALSCKWLMGPCEVNAVTLADGTSWTSGVFVERCKYLEESKCVGICINTCKLPTQTFFKDYMGVPLVMEPNFHDYSCQFKFGVVPPAPEEESCLKEPCLEKCPFARPSRESGIPEEKSQSQCPKL